jgi:uncharacterized membrane protein YfcA
VPEDRLVGARLAVLFGSPAGVASYRRMSEVNFGRAVRILLIVSGISLVMKALIWEV